MHGRALTGGEGLDRFHARIGDHDDLAGLDIPDIDRAEDVESASLRSEDHRAVLEATENQRPHAERIAHADQRILGQRNKRIRALDLLSGRR